jgi:glycosyltransferase involved in cell wall biosynthesis
MTAVPSHAESRNRPIQMLMVTHYFDSHAGGIEFVARELFRRLSGPGCQMTWAAAGISASPQTGDWSKALPLKSSNWLERAVGIPFPIPTLGAVRKLWAAVRNSKVVLVHDCLYLSNIAAFLFAKRRRVPVVIVQHTGKLSSGNPFINALMTGATKFITRAMVRRASQVIFISGTTQQHFKTNRFHREPILLFNGVETTMFYPVSSEADKAGLRRRYGLASDRPVILFVGRFVQSKGMHILERMVRAAPDITWVFVGTGPIDPSSWGANVKIFSDLPQKSVGDLYRAADLFVLPSRREGFPLVVQEALACGLQIVCSVDITTADEAISSVVHGVPLTQGNDEQTANDFLTALRSVLDRGQSADERIRKLQLVEERYAWSKVVKRYAELVEAVSGCGGSAASEDAAAALPIPLTHDDHQSVVR